MTSRFDVEYGTRSITADVTISIAGVFLLISSAMEILQGIAAMADPEFYAAGTEYLYQFNVKAWGAIHLVLGIAGVVIAVAILRRASWAPPVGMIVAGLTIVGNFLSLPRSPVWSVVVIAFSVFVIWAFGVRRRNDRVTGPAPSTPTGVVPSHPRDPHDVIMPPSP